MDQARAQQAYTYFLGKGLTPAQAAGIVGNMQAESGLNPESVNSIGCIGLVQWCGGRRRPGLQTGNPDADFQTQLDYVWSELNGGESHALTMLRAATSAEQAAQVFEATYERSGGALIPQRIMYAAQIFDSAATGQWAASGATSDGGSGGGTNLVSTITDNLPVVGTVLSTAHFLGAVWKALTSRTFWLRVGELMLGTILLLAGLWLMASESNAIQRMSQSAAPLAAAAV